LGLSGGGGVDFEEVAEGSEPAEFKKALGPQDKKAYDVMLQGASSRSHAEAEPSATNRERDPCWLLVFGV